MRAAVMAMAMPVGIALFFLSVWAFASGVVMLFLGEIGGFNETAFRVLPAIAAGLFGLCVALLFSSWLGCVVLDAAVPAICGLFGY